MFCILLRNGHDKLEKNVTTNIRMGQGVTGSDKFSWPKKCYFLRLSDMKENEKKPLWERGNRSGQGVKWSGRFMNPQAPTYHELQEPIRLLRMPTKSVQTACAKMMKSTIESLGSVCRRCSHLCLNSPGEYRNESSKLVGEEAVFLFKKWEPAAKAKEESLTEIAHRLDISTMKLLLYECIPHPFGSVYD